MKTAVTWLDQQIKEKMGLDEHDTNQLKWFIDKALEKEKEQMIDFAMQMHKIDCSKTGTDLLFDEAESYYNQTYNQNK
jgi:hypothetical protein